MATLDSSNFARTREPTDAELALLRRLGSPSAHRRGDGVALFIGSIAMHVLFAVIILTTVVGVSKAVGRQRETGSCAGASSQGIGHAADGSCSNGGRWFRATAGAGQTTYLECLGVFQLELRQSRRRQDFAS